MVKDAYIMCYIYKLKNGHRYYKKISIYLEKKAE